MKNHLYINSFNYFNENQHLNKQSISLYADALRMDKQKQLPIVILDHVEKCKECKVQIMALHSLVKDQDYTHLGAHPYLDKDNDSKAQIQKSIGPDSPLDKQSDHYDWLFYSVRIAAILIFGISLSVMIYFTAFQQKESFVEEKQNTVKTEEDLTSGEETGTEEQLQEDQITENERQGKRNIQTRLFAANFEESPNLEDLIDQEQRAFGIKVLSPKNEIEIEGETRFQWEIQYKGTFYLKILDNREDVLFEFETNNTQYLFDKKLQPGLYYWKLESDDELFYVGKFVVQR